MIKPMRLFVILILAITCDSAFALKNPLAKIDQVSFIQQLKKKRPDLVASECKNNLILKLKYRKDVLTKKTDYQKLMSSNYTAEQRAQDAIWSEKFRVAARKLRAQMEVNFITSGVKNTLEQRQSLDYFVADYDPASFVGYQVKGPIDFDKNGMMAKVFLSFKSAIDDLNPDSSAFMTP